MLSVNTPDKRSFDIPRFRGYYFPMVRIVKSAILLFWLVMLGQLAYRTYLQPTSVVALGVITEEGVRAGDEWFGIYQQGRKIGYANTRLSIEGDAYRIAEESEMDILALGKLQHVRTVINAYTTRNFLLKYFDFSLEASGTAMNIKGAVVKRKLVLDIITAGQTRKERIPLKEPVYVTPNIRPAIVLMGLEPGKRFRFPLFNPAAMSTGEMTVTVESKETIKVGDAEQTVYKLRQEYGGLEAAAWINQDGETLKEESPLGFTLLKETRLEARKLDKQGPAVDIISLVRIPSADIPNSGETTYLKARIGNVRLDGFELDGDRQSLHDNVIEVSAGTGTGSFPLPFLGTGHAADLSATSFIQTDDPSIQRETKKALGSIRDSREASRKLTAWVYDAIIKQPVVSIPSAVDVLKQRTGDCNEHTALYTAMARAAGIPTRMAAGIVYMKNGFYYHAWPEVWLNQWVAVDPTFNQFPADATHIRFVTGDLGKQAEIMKLVGKLKMEVLEYR